MSKIGEQVEKAMEDLASDLEEEYYGVGDTSTSTTITVDGINTTVDGTNIDCISTAGTSIVDNTIDPYWGTSTGDIVFSGTGGGYENQAVVSIGPLQISATEDGEVEVILETDEFREEYHFSAKTMRGLLRKLADVVVEGKET